jgi:group I intron endonuclease
MARKEKKYHYIYKTTNLKNGKYYVGMHSTDNLEDGYMGSGKRLRRSLNKHGKENFKFEILEFLPNRVSLREREKELVNEELVKDDTSMNIKLGGDGGFINETHQLKCSIAGGKAQANRLKNDTTYFQEHLKRFRKISDEYHKIRTNYNTFEGKKHTEESRIKMSEKAKLRTNDKNSQFGTCWITNGKENKKIHRDDSIPDGWKLGRK